MNHSSTVIRMESQESNDQRREHPQQSRAADKFKDTESSQPAVEELLPYGSPSHKKGIVMAGIPLESDNRIPAKMQTLLQQVRSQIRSQAGLTSAKTSMFELMQQIKDREVELASLNGQPDGDGGDRAGAEAKDGGETVRIEDQGKTEPEAMESVVPSCFEAELESTRKTLREEYEQQISQLRVEMRAYTDRAVKDIESRMKSSTITHSYAKGKSREQMEGKAVLDKKQKTAPSLTSRRSCILTRTMTTITPKTCVPVIIGPRAKSETLNGCRDGNSLLMKESDFRVFHSHISSRHPQNRNALPPVHQPTLPRQKPVWTTAHTGS